MPNREYDEILNKAERIHFIGIGGSGMCPIAEILINEGKHITGSDVDNESDTVNRIRSYGVEVAIGHRAENVGDAQLVVYTAAVQKDNPELLESARRGIPTAERSIILGALCRRYDRTIGVSGTHGKTTTTSMITQILVGGDLDPSVVIGGKLPLIGANGLCGNSDVMVCESCEFVDTFLQITPACAVILNVDEDHLDYFGTLENIVASFNKFAGQTRDLVIVNGDDENAVKAVEGISAKVTTFGLKAGNDYCAENLTVDKSSEWEFDIIRSGEFLCHVSLKVPGHHNVLNSLAAAAAAIYAGAKPQDIAKGLSSFTGAGRRYEIHTVSNGVTVADDYAHHPTEIEAILSACMQMGFRKVWAVFQPFTYTRTKTHLAEFARVLSLADEVLLTPIMAAREIDDLGVNSEQLRDLISGARLFDTFSELAEFAVENAQSGDLIITMGCGDIYKCAKMMTKMYKEKG
jgi:UDP-N-acetylmuramate--alanine ligase